MSSVIRKAVLGCVDVLGLVWRLLPARVRETVVMGLFMLESRPGDPAQALRRLLRLQKRLDLVINERALAYGGGVHPKHRLMRYHDFFVDRIAPGSRVLDIGCGYGAVARSIATRVPHSTVVGVELDKGRLAQARSGEVPPNLSFVEADATRDLPAGAWNAVVLSNVLEHIEDRVSFLKSIVAQVHPDQVLIRVPLFERDWKVALGKDLGVDYFSDPTHYIEHSPQVLTSELTLAGLEQVETVLVWGEIWTRCRPNAKSSPAAVKK
jgi:2-polyprenyl-3-methyl-5-hydroxy-6-metoxy-1,4-benzoquinol methylase